MKKNILQAASGYLLFILFSFINLVSFAQDSTSTTHKTVTTSTTREFVMQPWMWIAGGVVALILIIALVSSAGKKEVIKTTVVKQPRQ